MEIDGVGENGVRKLVENGKIKTVADIHALGKEDLSVLENFSDQSIDYLLSSIEHNKKTALLGLLNAIEIPSIGEKTAKNVANDFQN
jgi:DNA ligase (NAD+)